MQKSGIIVTTDTCCPTGSGCKPRQIGLLRAGTHSVSVSCCPIEIGEFKYSKTIPNNSPNQRKQTGETVRPLALEGDESQEHVKKQSRPDLPLNGILGVTEEVAYFEGLLDLFKECFDAPPATIQVTDAGRCPFKVVGQKDHHDPFIVDLNPGFDAAKTLRILRSGLWCDQGDFIIADDISFGFFQVFAADATTKVVLSSCNPKDASGREIEKVGEVYVGLVKDGDLSGFKPDAQRHGASIVVVGGLFDDGERGKKALQVKPQMQLSRSLAPPVLGPVHRIGYQSNGCRIDGVNVPPEAVWQSRVSTGRTESGSELLKMIKDLPKKGLHHIAVAVFVGIRKSVATGRHRSANHGQFCSVMAQGVANIIEADGMGKLSKKQTHHVTPRGKNAGLFIHTIIARKFLRQMRRDQFTKLMQCVGIILGWCCFFHSSGFFGRNPGTSHLFLSKSQDWSLQPVG